MSLTLSPGTKTKVGRPSVIEAHPEVVEIKKAVKERQKQSLAYVMECQTGHQSLHPIWSTLEGRGET